LEIFMTDRSRLDPEATVPLDGLLQALPGGFNQQPSTAANFYQTTSPEIPVALTNAFNSLYSSLAGYQANTYGAQVGAISRQPSGAEQFGQIATGLGNLIKI
jgi:hypothetical protein